MDKLLPNNQTKLEEDLLKSADFQDRGLTNAVANLPGIKYSTIPNSVVPWLILEYGLNEVSKWIPDQRQALEEGIPWSRIRGTPGSVKLALGWINFTADTINENRYRAFTYEIDTGEIPDPELIDNIIALARLSESDRSKLNRLFHGLDLKPFTLNDPEAGLNLGIFSNFSGNFDETNNIWLSFLTQTSEGFDLTNVLDLSLGISTFIDFFQGFITLQSTTILNTPPPEFALLGAGTFTSTGLGLVFPRGQVFTDSLYIGTIVNEVEFILGSN